MQGVSAHLSYKDNAEKYRRVFVDHDKKETIVMDGTKCFTGEVIKIQSKTSLTLLKETIRRLNST